VEANRNFANKVWNAGRFVISAVDNAPTKPGSDPQWTVADEFIHARMRQVTRDVNRLFASYQFGEAGRQVYDFFWGEFADWYIESAKLQLKRGGDTAFYTAWTLMRVMDKSLRLLHPYTPYVTEEIWGKLRSAAQSKGDAFDVNGGWADALIIAPWPRSKEEEEWEEKAVNSFANGAMEHVRAFRSLKTDLGIPIKQRTGGTIIIEGDFRQVIDQQVDLISSLSNIDDLEILSRVPDLEEYKKFPSMSIPAVGSIVYLKTAGVFSSGDMRGKLENELDMAHSHIKRLEKLLSSDFADKAPPQVVAKEKEKLEKYIQTAAKLKDQISSPK
jgi:valyl-tRNA synthetase